MSSSQVAASPSTPPSPPPANPPVGHSSYAHPSAPPSCDPLAQAPEPPDPRRDRPVPAIEVEIVDSRTFARRNRERTSTQDKATLEAAYLQNPRPDRAARREIGERVSLTDRQVQIWFQNKRQSERRKARPLTADELAAFASGRMHAPGRLSFSSDTSFWPGQGMSTREQDHPNPLPTDDAGGRPGTAPGALLSKAGGDTHGKETLTSAASARKWEPPDLSRSFPGSVGYLANRWNPPNRCSTPSSLHHDQPFRREPPPSSSLPLIGPDLALPPMRLSTSLEGRAELVPSIPPPPPLPTAAPPTGNGLLRERPAREVEMPRLARASAVTLPHLSTVVGDWLPPARGPPPPPRPTGVRSRDVQEWESCCGSEGRRDPLTVQAEQESSGSAVAAISLLRQSGATGPSPLQPSSSAKRNAAMGNAPAGGRKKPKLGRAASSIARMQTTTTTTTKLGPGEKRSSVQTRQRPDKPSDKYGPGSYFHLRGNDSDKENESPDEGTNPRGGGRSRANVTGRHPLPSGPMSGRDGGPKRPPPLLSSRANTAPTGSRSRRAPSPLDIYEDDDAAEDKEKDDKDDGGGGGGGDDDDDDEVKRFMGGAAEGSPSKKADVDAVAGLLSLSKGDWRR